MRSTTYDEQENGDSSNGSLEDKVIDSRVDNAFKSKAEGWEGMDGHM